MKYIILTFCLLINLHTIARPIIIDISNLLGSAKYIDEVVITNYDGKGKVYIRSLILKDTINSASCGRQITNGWKFPYKQQEDNWTENQPFIGDTVLVVIDGYDRIKVYGKRIKGDFRLWSPSMSRSLALFRFESPIKPIEVSKQFTSSDTSSFMACWDGCLIPTDKLDSLVQKYKANLSTKINSISLTQFKGEPTYSIFYNDTLLYFSDLTWTNEPPGKLHSLLLSYSNGKILEIIPAIDEQHPRQFSDERKFDLDKVKQMKIQEIRWIE
ncbi:MAG: hypothetical protein RL660_658 [Bacteroidota bacterium]